ncbi:MAG TPA: DUF2075 domain-containing protein [Bryobacteraceae bacterium]|nr:DUF2075 domain-containing protein [Bryobacteraceae bacterium]
MPAIYHASVSEFLNEQQDFVIGCLSKVAGRASTELTSEQLEAWREQITILQSALVPQALRGWHLLLEYPIPRRGKRIDAVILAQDLIFVVEFKCGARHYSREARLQTEDYCLDLRDFHAECVRRILVPVVVATLAEERPIPREPVVDWVAPLCFANARTFANVIDQAIGQYAAQGAEPFDPSRWDQAPYAPTPSIVEAARVLYEGQSVREISRHHAGAENLTRTSVAIMSAIEQARRENYKLICFITGVPGSGKTLAGLNLVHSRELHQGRLGVLLSGNGPLVRVLCEALARDHCARTKRPIGESRREVETLIQNVHRFIDAHFASSSPPPDAVIVFDEAQRAWNREQSERKFKRDRSEPEIMLEIMDRREGWAVIVALVGTGQEINTGEAGLREWGRALTARFRHWKVLVSPHATGRERAELLFEERPNEITVFEDPALHLNVAQRSYKADAVSEFVRYLLEQRTARARVELASCSKFPILMTRDLQRARAWLKHRQRGTRRIGLVATSGARRLRAYGLDVRSELDVENWFLNPSTDVRSSYYLETPATEFGIQGLELDWTGVCWDLDLVPERQGWEIRAFKGTCWQSVRDATRRQYVLNKYRVLLTRAREGMIIWVPKGDPDDPTRPPSKYDSIAAYLKSCGLPEL